MSSLRGHLFCTLVFLVVTLVAPSVQEPECISYEVHERSLNSPGQSKALTENCISAGGYLDNYNSEPLRKRGPVSFNITFDCCMNRTCSNDLECPFNFNCNLTESRCTITSCDLSDEVDLILNEGQDCDIDEDCTFPVPADEIGWKCIAVPCPSGNCVSRDKCKRCSKAPHSRIPVVSSTTEPSSSSSTRWWTASISNTSSNETVPSLNSTTELPLDSIGTTSSTASSVEVVEPLNRTVVTTIATTTELIPSTLNSATSIDLSSLSSDAVNTTLPTSSTDSESTDKVTTLSSSSPSTTTVPALPIVATLFVPVIRPTTESPSTSTIA
ncbi:hypothetical protein HDE_05141 [Halotydeus destructor]|nr:hypothetical protein HDE_05141 [Halotydeus destructor]